MKDLKKITFMDLLNDNDVHLTDGTIHVFIIHDMNVRDHDKISAFSFCFMPDYTQPCIVESTTRAEALMIAVDRFAVDTSIVNELDEILDENEDQRVNRTWHELERAILKMSSNSIVHQDWHNLPA